MCSVLKVSLSYILQYKVCADFVYILFPSNRLMDLMNRPFEAQWFLRNTCLEDFVAMEFSHVSCVKWFKSIMLGEPPVSSSSGFWCQNLQNSDDAHKSWSLKHQLIGPTWHCQPAKILLCMLRTHYISVKYYFQINNNYFPKQH